MQAATAKSEDAMPPMGDFEEVFHRHNRIVYRAAYRVMGNPSDAEDVMQTVFLRMLKRQDSLDLGDNPEGYMHRTAVNAALDLLRSRKANRSIPLEDVAPRFSDDASPDPEQRHHAGELREWLRKAIAGLNQTAAEMFTLRYFEGYGNQEIAEIMGTSQGTVAVTLHRTRSRLQEEIGKLLKEKE